MSAIEWLKKYAHLAKNASSWGVLLTLAWGGEPRYSFLYDIPSQQRKGPASFPPRTREDTLEIARYEAAKDTTLPEDYSISVALCSPDGAFVGKWAFTSSEIRGE
jgi:hypothetical protein